MEQRDTIVRLIGAAKLLKGVVLVAVGVGALRLLHDDVGHEIHRWIHVLHVADDNHYVRVLISQLTGLPHHDMQLVAIASLSYAGLFLIEGTGLLLRALWAEYVTIIITTSFIPLEIYELVEHRSIVKAIVTALNVAIVVYLVWRLHRNRHWPFRR